MGLVVVIFLVAVLLAAPVGWWIGGRRRRAWMPVASVALAVTVAYPMIAQRPDWLLAIYPSEAFAVIDPVWFVPFALLFLGVAVRQVDRRLTRVTAAVLAAFLVTLGGGSALWVASGATIEARRFVDAEGVVRQTTYYTCGAAASATLCRQYGVDASEAEMALATQVVPGCGTTMVKVYWAIRNTLGDRASQVQLLHCPVLERGKVPTPCVADLRIAFGLNHLVMVREVLADFVVIEDPMTGLGRVPLEEARSMWNGAVVSVAMRRPVMPLAAPGLPLGETAVPAAPPRLLAPLPTARGR